MLEQEVQEASLKLNAAEAALATLGAELDNQELQQKVIAAAIEAAYRKAALQAEINEKLAARQLLSPVLLQQSQLDAEQLLTQRDLGVQQLAYLRELRAAKVSEHTSTIEQARALLALRTHQADALTVRAGVDGVLQIVTVEVGQQVTPGTNLARIVNPAKLKAEIKISEADASAVREAQHAEIDTHNGIISGHVTRVDPTVQNGTVTVDVSLDAHPPPGTRPDLSVDAKIEISRLENVLFVARPPYAQANSLSRVFKIAPDGSSRRVDVQFGKSSVSVLEVAAGLREGDRIIVSDMSEWNGVDRIWIK